MNKKLILFSFLLFTINCLSQSFEWAREFEGLTDHYTDYATDIAVDDSGNSYILGRTESFDFDLNPTFDGTDVVDLSGQMYPGMVFLVKLDNNGNYIWGHAFGNFRQGDQAYNLEIGSDGNIYALAQIQYYDGTQNVSFGKNTIYKIAPGGNILNTVELPYSYGNWGSNYMDAIYFTLDASNNIYLTGRFGGNITFQNNTGLQISANVPTSFLLKINNSGTGLWLKQFDAITPGYFDPHVLVRPDGDVNILIQDVLLETNYGFKIYDIEADNGATIWQRELKYMNAAKMHITQNEIVVSANNSYWEPIDVDPTDGILYTTIDHIVIYLGFDGSFLFHQEFDTFDLNMSINSITSDQNNNLYLSGTFQNTVDFDPSENVYSVTAPEPSGNESFCLKLDTDRNFSSLLHFGQEVPTTSWSAWGTSQIESTIVKNGSYYFCGRFSSLVDFDPSLTSSFSISAWNDQVVNINGFISKLSMCTTDVPQATASQTFCAGINPTIANLSPASSSIVWYNSTNATTALPSNTVLLNGTTYYAATQNGSCAESTRTPVTVTITPAPAAPVITAQAFCESQAATLASINTGGQTINWYSNAADAITLPATTLLAMATYYAAQVANGCESIRIPVAVTVTNVALPSAPDTQTFCLKQNVTTGTLTATGQNLQWYDAATAGNLIPASMVFTANTTLYLTQTVNGCESNRLPVNLVINQAAAPTGSATQVFCTAANPVAGDLIIAGTNIILYDALTAGVMVPSNTALVNGATYYASQTINGCESVNRLAVTVSIVSALSVTDYNVEVCDEGNDGSEGINLANYNQYLTAPATGLTYNYYQNLTAAQNSDSSYEVTDDYMLQGNKVVYVQITSANGCSSIAALSLTLLQTPETTISDVLEICNEPLHVDAGMLFDDYLWSGGSTTTSIEITQPGNYWFTGTIYGVTTSCSITKNFQVISAEQPSIASIEVNQPANGNSMLIVHTTSMGNYQYSLDNVNYQNSNIFSNIKPGNYIVYVKNDCAIAVKMLTIPGFPAYFTPNGDGENDNWYVHYASKNAGFITSIYDRYGKLIANLKPGERWDGTFNGHNLPATDYWFTAIQNSDGYTHKGHFSLIR